MTDWIEHDAGPQPVADGVWIRAEYDQSQNWRSITTASATAFVWNAVARFRILNQHLIDAARLEGIRLGLEAAHMAVGEMIWVGTPSDHDNVIMRAEATIIALDPATIAKENAR